MNARGSTEVVVATIGMTVGLLSQPIFTLIVIVAITTTISTPPILKWLLASIPAHGEERERLEREAAEAEQFVPHVERILVVTEERSGHLAERLAGVFAGSRQVMTTILPLDAGADSARTGSGRRALDTVTDSAERGTRHAARRRRPTPSPRCRRSSPHRRPRVIRPRRCWPKPRRATT